MGIIKPPVKNIWADTGDKTEPTAGEVSTGWPASSSAPSRQRFNWILNYCANAVRYFSRRGLVDYDAAETYAIGDRVIGDDGLTYKSLQATNTNHAPSTSPTWWESWGEFAKTAVGSGTANTHTATYSSTLSLVNGITLAFKANATNTSTTPTFSPNALTAKIIVRDSNKPLAIGDIQSGKWHDVRYDSTMDKWVLLNPLNAVGGTWQDFLSSRATDTTYTNDTGKPLPINVTLLSSASVATIACLTDGQTIFGGSAETPTRLMQINILIAPGSTYRIGVNAGVPSLQTWHEMR
jgi:hypothetical protein